MKHLLTKADIDALREHRRVHQFDAGAVRHTRNIGDALGMTRLGVSLVRLMPGDASTTYHRHLVDEEFLYILEGRARAFIGGETREVAAGDFMGFPAGSEPHRLVNDTDAPCVYLMGGERNLVDICEYPDQNRRMIRHAGRKEWADTDAFKPVKIDKET